MGNICGKESATADSFSTAGRTLGASAQAQPTRASVPAKITSTTPGRTLGGRESPETGRGDARSAAAKAAEERAVKAGQTKGKLSTQLAEQKKQTRNDTLDQVSKDGRRFRDADEGAEARNWN